MSSNINAREVSIINNIQLPKTTMTKLIYEITQRFAVGDDNIPRLIHTNITVLEGGFDLLSIAKQTLDRIGFSQKFKEKQTSQYTGYTGYTKTKTAKIRYRLILTQYQDSISVSLPKTLVDSIDFDSSIQDTLFPYCYRFHFDNAAELLPFLDKYGRKLIELDAM